MAVATSGNERKRFFKYSCLHLLSFGVCRLRFPPNKNVQTPQPTSGVTMSNLLDIAVSLFGGAGGGGTKTNNTNRADGRRYSGEKLVTFTVDVHTGSSMTLGVTVKELGGGAVYVEVRQWLIAANLCQWNGCCAV